MCPFIPSWYSAIIFPAICLIHMQVLRWSWGIWADSAASSFNALYLDTFPLLVSFPPVLRYQVLSLHKRILIRCFMTNPTLYSLKYKFDVDKLPPSLGFQKYNTILVLLRSLWLYVGELLHDDRTQALSRPPPGSSLCTPWPGRPISFHGLTINYCTDNSNSIQTQLLLQVSVSCLQLVVTKHLFLDIFL